MKNEFLLIDSDYHERIFESQLGLIKISSLNRLLDRRINFGEISKKT